MMISMHHHRNLNFRLQGLYEYVRPAWEARPRPANVDLDLKTFGACLPRRPTLNDGTSKDEPRLKLHLFSKD